MDRAWVLIIFLCIMLHCTQGLAQDCISQEDLLNEIRALKKTVADQERRIAELEARVPSREAAPQQVVLADTTLEDLDRHIDSCILHREGGYQLLGGLELGAGMTIIGQGTHNANGDSLSEAGEDVADGSYSFDLSIYKAFEEYGAAFALIEAGEGAGIEDELKLFSNVNFDTTGGDSTLGIVEAWYEQYIGPAALTFGKLDSRVYIDTNEYANCECTQFIGRMFKNSAAIEFPDNAAGVRLGWTPAGWVDVDTLIMDADSDWEDIGDEVFFAGQVTVRPAFCERPGRYRLIGWLNDAGHTRWADETNTKEEAYGFGVSVDQELTPALGLFMRYGWQDPDERLNGLDDDFSIEHAWSLGARLKGAAWGREEDVLACAIGQVVPSDDYKEADSSREADCEGHLELYYSFKVNGHCMVTPDLQIIWNPYGSDASQGDDTILVGGIRTQIDF
ncbi:MAG: carbohydrate porin [Candidatus Omnitrophica bacterium]|nr:carbohydrate porin [Candidatus Omnitrophota bacterium]